MVDRDKRSDDDDDEVSRIGVCLLTANGPAEESVCLRTLSRSSCCCLFQLQTEEFDDVDIPENVYGRE